MNVFGDEEGHVELPLTTENGRFCLFSIRFSQDGNEILGGANDGFIYLFDRMSQVQSLKVRTQRGLPPKMDLFFLLLFLLKYF